MSPKFPYNSTICGRLIDVVDVFLADQSISMSEPTSTHFFGLVRHDEARNRLEQDRIERLALPKGHHCGRVRDYFAKHRELRQPHARHVDQRLWRHRAAERDAVNNFSEHLRFFDHACVRQPAAPGRYAIRRLGGSQDEQCDGPQRHHLPRDRSAHGSEHHCDCYTDNQAAGGGARSQSDCDSDRNQKSPEKCRRDPVEFSRQVKRDQRADSDHRQVRREYADLRQVVRQKLDRV